MSIKFKRINLSNLARTSKGMTILDVLLGILIFVIGMLALASMQGNLTRSSSDASQRTVGANLAEELIEQLRQFDALETGKGTDTYQDIANQTFTAERNGTNYSIGVTVEDYYFMLDGVTVTKDTDDLPSDRSTTISDFKYVELAVTWDGVGFQGAQQDDADTAGDESRLGTGAFTVSTIIPAVLPMGAAKIAAEDDEGAGTPPVVYTPGEAPDIVAISLDGTKFKESTTPEPVVYRRDELLETWFDVITYSKATDPNIFLRREEFVAVSCECLLHEASGSEEDGRLPTLWNGAEYVEGAKVGKQYGTPTTGGSQSQYCDVCCNDHHDDGGGDSSYRPWRTGSFSGDHPHYNRDKDGNFVEAIAGPAEIKGNESDYTYIEACRLVRKDGFFRVAQDFNLNQINAFPENYPGSSDVSSYSSYIAAVANHEMGEGSDPGSAASTLKFEGYDEANRSEVTDARQQLRSRGIYVDTRNPILDQAIKDCFPTKTDDCEIPNATSIYELYPFFDVQLTHIARWKELVPNNPVHITDDEIRNTSYSRGLASLAGSKEGPATGESSIEMSNAGLLSILPVTDDPEAEYGKGYIYLQAGVATEPPPSGGQTITGSITAQGGIDASAVQLVLNGSASACNKNADWTFECTVPEGIEDLVTLTISNYYKKNKHLWVCSNSGLALAVERVPSDTASDGGSAAGNYTVFNVDPTASNLVFAVTTEQCPVIP